MAGSVANGEGGTGEERRSGAFGAIGIAAGAWLLLLLGLVTAKILFQAENWRTYTFRDALPLARSCQVAARVTAPGAAWPGEELAAALRPAQLPHRRGALGLAAGSGPADFHVLYHCEADLMALKRQSGASWLHLGWVFARTTRVTVNGSHRLTVFGDDKVSVPLSAEDLAADRLSLDIEATDGDGHRLGLSGVQPPVIASGTGQNFAIFGLETTLELGLNQFKFMILVILGLVLALAWLLRLRSRLLQVGFFYFVTAATWYGVPLVKDWLPFESVKVHVAMSPWLYASGIGVLLVGAEASGFGGRWSFRVMAGVGAAATAATAALLAHAGTYLNPAAVGTIWHGLMIAGVMALGVLAAAGRARSHRSAAVQRGMAGFLAAFGAAHAADLWLSAAATGVYLAPYVDLLLPAVLLPMIFGEWRTAETMLRREREVRAELSEQLALAMHVQRLTQPGTRILHEGDARAGYAHQAATGMSGDWVAHWRGHGGEAHFVIGDVVGKGPQAALAAAAVQALIRDRGETDSPATLVRRLDRLLAGMFKRTMLTTVSGCTVHPDGRVELINHGGMGWAVWDGVRLRYLPMPHRPVGTGDLDATAVTTLTLAAGGRLLTFTDGVCQGARALKAWLRACEGHLAGGGSPVGGLAEQLLAIEVEKPLVDDQSLLVIEAASKAPLVAAST